MIPLVRGPMPRILAEKSAAWTQQHVAEHGAGSRERPRSDRYSHPEVRIELRRMSGGKCFYCERVLTESEQEVDHHIEVAERPDLAFDWPNLYLSCESCNRYKQPNLKLAVTACVDPCDPNAKPADHITFNDERIEARHNSAQGSNTVRKYSLNREELDLARSRALNEFHKALDLVRQRQLAGKRKSISPDERELLLAFGNSARPFSLMMATYLRRLGL